MTAEPVQIRIVGQGPVALSLRLFAQRAGVPLASIQSDLTPDPTLSVRPDLAARTIALSLGSWQLLARIIELPKACAIREVEVSLQGHSGRTRISSAEMGTPALGYVTNYGALLQALFRAASTSASTSGSASALTSLEARASSDTSPDSTTTPTITIHAEGNPGEDVDSREFTQHAVLAELHCPEMPAHCAIERFTRDGPVALLPLSEPGKFSLVWCCAPQQALHRVSQDEAGFLEDLRGLLGPRIHRARLCSTRTQSALQRRVRKKLVSGTELWIGNAAQSLHPVAGQGLNLGLRDSFELAQSLGQLAQQSSGADLKHIEAGLRRYADNRRPDRQRTIRITDTLASVFTRTWMAPAQSLALSLLDLTPNLRGAFAQRMMFGNRRAGFSNFD